MALNSAGIFVSGLDVVFLPRVPGTGGNSAVHTAVARFLLSGSGASAAGRPQFSFPMPLKPFAFIVLTLALNGVAAPLGQAHHGPPHDEVDEFDTPAARLAVPVPPGGVSWPALVLSVAGVAAVFALSRRYGIDALESAPARMRR